MKKILLLCNNDSESFQKEDEKKMFYIKIEDNR